MADPVSPLPAEEVKPHESPRSVLLLLAAGLLAADPSSAAAQVADPDTMDPFERREWERRLYVARSTEEILGVLDEWVLAWKNGNDGAFAASYFETAVVHLPGAGEMASGRDEIRRTFFETVPVVSEVSVGIVSLDVRDRLAYTTGGYRYRISPDVPGGGKEVLGTYIMVFRRVDEGWKIRSHLFRPVR